MPPLSPSPWKSELSIHPFVPPKGASRKAHVMLAFLGYALWVTLKDRLAVEPPVPPNEADNSNKRRHRFTHYRWPRNPFTPHHRTHHSVAATTRPAWLQPSSAFSIQSKM
jgi:hypothetical protein